jgi:hypothetical protein
MQEILDAIVDDNPFPPGTAAWHAWNREQIPVRQGRERFAKLKADQEHLLAVMPRPVRRLRVRQCPRVSVRVPPVRRISRARSPRRAPTTQIRRRARSPGRSSSDGDAPSPPSDLFSGFRFGDARAACRFVGSLRSYEGGVASRGGRRERVLREARPAGRVA